MTCPFTMAAFKKEAELYIAQGLYPEALDLYRRFLGQATSLHPRQRRHIRAAMEQIEARIDTHPADENQLLNDPAILRIRKGWRGAGSLTDVLVSAQAFRNIGRYDAAFAEYRQLLLKKQLTGEVAEGVADCLAHMVRPETFVRAIDVLADQLFRFFKNSLMFKVLIAMHLDAQMNPSHFEALYRHLVLLEDVPYEIRELIQNLEQTLIELSADSGDDAYGPIPGLDDLYTDWTRNDKRPPDE